MAESKRASLERQLLAVQAAARTLKSNNALQDATRTLLELCRAEQVLWQPDADPDKVSEYLERIFLR